MTPAVTPQELCPGCGRRGEGIRQEADGALVCSVCGRTVVTAEQAARGSAEPMIDDHGDVAPEATPPVPGERPSSQPTESSSRRPLSRPALPRWNLIGRAGEIIAAMLEPYYPDSKALRRLMRDWLLDFNAWGSMDPRELRTAAEAAEAGLGRLDLRQVHGATCVYCGRSSTGMVPLPGRFGGSQLFMCNPAKPLACRDKLPDAAPS